MTDTPIEMKADDPLYDGWTDVQMFRALGWLDD